MNKKRTTRVSLAKDGSGVEHRAEGTKVAVKGRTDWGRLAAMTDEEVRRAAQSDPDARPRSVRELSQACTVPEDVDVRAIRLKRKMSQAAFAQVYGFALDAILDWEQGRRMPNRSPRILLAVIDKEPEAVERALS